MFPSSYYTVDNESNDYYDSVMSDCINIGYTSSGSNASILITKIYNGFVAVQIEVQAGAGKIRVRGTTSLSVSGWPVTWKEITLQ